MKNLLVLISALLSIPWPVAAQDATDTATAQLLTAISYVRDRFPPEQTIRADTQRIRTLRSRQEVRVIEGLDGFAAAASTLGWVLSSWDDTVECTEGLPDDCWLPEDTILAHARIVRPASDPSQPAHVLVGWSRTSGRPGARRRNAGLDGQSFLIEVGFVNEQWQALRIIASEIRQTP